jgi:hypothetical protein
VLVLQLEAFVVEVIGWFGMIALTVGVVAALMVKADRLP